MTDEPHEPPNIVPSDQSRPSTCNPLRQLPKPFSLYIKPATQLQQKTLLLPTETHSSTMLLRVSSAIPSPSVPEAPSSSFWSYSAKPSRRTPRGRPPLLATASGVPANRALAGVVFEPFEEVKKELSLVPSAPHDSLARQKYADDCEAAINGQIK